MVSFLAPQVSVVGSIHMDFFILMDHLPVPGETVLGKSFTMQPGGKGANQAVAAARLGAKTYMVGRVGGDIFAEEVLNNFRRNGVDVSYVRRDPETHTGVAFIFVDSRGENMIAVAPGADARVSTHDVDSAIDVISSSDVLMLQLEIPIETVVYAAKVAWEHNVKVVLNPAPARTLPEEIYGYIHVLTPNRIEAQMLSGVRIESREDIVKAAHVLMDKGVENVVITLGAEGALLVSEEGVYHIPAFKVRPVDTTGAGDAFNAALAVAIAEGRSLREAVRLANAAAAIKITRVGAQAGLPYRRDLEEFLKDVR